MTKMTIAPFRRLHLLLPLMLGLTSCTKSVEKDNVLTIWVHSGQQAERQVIEEQVKRFNASQNEIAVRVTWIPEGAYNAQVQAAALSKDLPDVLEFDGPFVYNYVWQRNLIPIDNLISQEVRADLIPSVIKQGTYNNRLYSVATFDSGLGLYARRSQLKAAGVRIPQGNQDAWTASEFNGVLAALAAKDSDRQVLDLKLNYRGEWFTYGFSPILASAGGDLIDRPNYTAADGTLNSPASVSAMQQVQGWISKGYVDPNIDDTAFTGKRVALSWVGHWVYQDYAKAIGSDLVVLPLPNFGKGSKTSQGSWNWGITTNCRNPQAAMKFLEFLLQPKNVLEMANANGAVPGTKRAIALSQLYAPGKPLSLFADQLLARKTVPRPQTPAYPVITSAFQEAFGNVRNGQDVKKALDRAATAIDLDIQDNQGYPQVDGVARSK